MLKMNITRSWSRENDNMMKKKIFQMIKKDLQKLHDAEEENCHDVQDENIYNNLMKKMTICKRRQVRKCYRWKKISPWACDFFFNW